MEEVMGFAQVMSVVSLVAEKTWLDSWHLCA